MNVETSDMVVGLVGHVIDQACLESMIKAIDNTGANLSEIKLLMPSIDKPSSVLLKITATDEEKKSCMELINSLVDSENFLLIKSEN